MFNIDWWSLYDNILVVILVGKQYVVNVEDPFIFKDEWMCYLVPLTFAVLAQSGGFKGEYLNE